jgi:hypothetical protein
MGPKVARKRWACPGDLNRCLRCSRSRVALRGVPRPVIQIPMLAMFHARQECALGGSATLQLVRDNDPWSVLAPLEQLAEESLRRLLVPPALHQDIEDMAVLIDGPPQIMPRAINREEHPVQVPLVAGSGTPAPELIGIGLPELQASLPNGLRGHDNPTGEQELFHIAVAQTEAKVEPDAMANDLGWEAVVLVTVR